MDCLYMHENEVEGDATFSCKEDNHLKLELCIASHVEIVLSPCDNWDTGIALLYTEMRVPEDQAFSVAAIQIFSHLM